MKSLVLGLLLFSASFAHADCTQIEAQVIARVSNVIAEDATTCTVTLDYSGPNSMVNSSYVCPLTPGEISNGVTLLKNNGVCSVKTGSPLSGILYKSLINGDDRIYLE